MMEREKGEEQRREERDVGERERQKDKWRENLKFLQNEMLEEEIDVSFFSPWICYLPSVSRLELGIKIYSRNLQIIVMTKRREEREKLGEQWHRVANDCDHKWQRQRT